MRIVSLLPSATEIICQVGLRDGLVGVTHECDWPPSVLDLPKVTVTHIPRDASSAEIDRLVSQELSGRMALYSLDFDALAAIEPDLIVTQTLCDVCAVNDVEVRDAAARLPKAAQVIYLEPTRLEHVLGDLETVAAAAGAAAAGKAARGALEARISAVRERVQVARGGDAIGGTSAQGGLPRVAVLEWLDPLFSSGHWTPELVALAGAVEPLARPGERSRRIGWSELQAADPDLLLIACCGFSVERAMQDVRPFLARPEASALRSVRSGAVFVCDGSAYFSRPGPRLVDSLEGLAGMIWGLPPLTDDAARIVRASSLAAFRSAPASSEQ